MIHKVFNVKTPKLVTAMNVCYILVMAALIGTIAAMLFAVVT